MADIFELFKKISSGSESTSSKPEFIVAGLGNFGAEYEKTRHNAGFMALDVIASKCNSQVKQAKFKSLVGYATIAGHSVLLMKPQTYMNLSGEAISEAANFYKISAENVIVICDDVCQAVGRMRIRKSGSAGGQNGLKNIISKLGCDTFPRIRIGVGEKPNREYDLAAWVLGKFPETDLKAVSERFSDSYDAVSLIIDGKIDEAMGKFNGKK